MVYLFEIYGYRPGNDSLSVIDRVDKIQEIEWWPWCKLIAVYSAKTNMASIEHVFTSKAQLDDFLAAVNHDINRPAPWDVKNIKAAELTPNISDNTLTGNVAEGFTAGCTPPNSDVMSKEDFLGALAKSVTSSNGLPRYDENAKAAHYQGYFVDKERGIELQWIDAISRTGRFKDPETFEACLELMVRNYLDRLGRKDDKLQELKKSRWYLDYWISYVENNLKK
jgi:hypothetical protein